MLAVRATYHGLSYEAERSEVLVHCKPKLGGALRGRVRSFGPPQGVSCAALASHRRMCDSSHMATNLAIDDQLLEEARRIGGQKTKRATVTEALSEYIQRRKQQQIVELFGKLDLDPKYDYKKQRRRK